ncbi:hypothetical protein CC78DRAFT_619205 [Lojkania enalia]|uniref:Uncharacterized protein n=1 Tax=Lojkania enalia TaxID=147567 RepID=A0A9P4K406_9PLEO|nr:hypothetical protein CC78DRAFT_619205 [Didymosphaeria enalia]
MQDSDDKPAKVKPQLNAQTYHGRYSIKLQFGSGSFGSFEDVTPSQFDERKYRRLQTVQKEASEHREEEKETVELDKDKNMIKDRDRTQSRSPQVEEQDVKEKQKREPVRNSKLSPAS